MSSPFDSAPTPIPVTVVTAGAVASPEAGASLVRLQPSLHEHDPGAECVACAARTDIRAILFDLLQQSRQPGNNPLVSVVVDASALADARPVVDRLSPGTLPALGLRDHTVLKSFTLSRVV